MQDGDTSEITQRLPSMWATCVVFGEPDLTERQSPPTPFLSLSTGSW